MEARFLILCILLVSLMPLSPAKAQKAAVLARPDWEEHLRAVKGTAEEYLRSATQGASDIQVNEVGYLQARRYYHHILLLNPGDSGVLASKEVVEQQLARFRRQHRWQLFKSGTVNAFRGTPSTRQVNNGRGLGLGRALLDVEAELPVIAELVPEQQFVLSHIRRSVPFFLQLQVGLGIEERAIPETDAAADLIAGHGSAEIGYTVLPILRYLLPYAGIGYRGIFGFYEDPGEGGDYFLHGTYMRLGAVLSLGRTIKLSAIYDRSLEIYGSEFNSSRWLGENVGVDSCKDCFDSWTGTQIGLEVMF
jgi:hypothetical protein